jgi:hypothetical protein
MKIYCGRAEAFWTFGTWLLLPEGAIDGGPKEKINE